MTHTARVASSYAHYHRYRIPAWMAKAACTPDPAWTSEHKPNTAILLKLSTICAACPVIADCAQHALDTSAHGGMWAGVWVPHRSNLAWRHARDALHRKTRPLTTTNGLTP